MTHLIRISFLPSHFRVNSTHLSRFCTAVWRFFLFLIIKLSDVSFNVRLNMSFIRSCTFFQMTWFSSFFGLDVSSVRIFHSSNVLKQFFKFLFHVDQSYKYFNEVIFVAFNNVCMMNISAVLKSMGFSSNTLRWGRLISFSDIWGPCLNFHLRMNFSWKQQLSSETFLLCLMSCLVVMWVTEFERKWMMRINSIKFAEIPST